MNLIPCINCGSKDHKKLTMSRGDRNIGAYGGKFRIVLCRVCGLCFLNPQPSHREYVQYYVEKNKDKKIDLKEFYEEKQFQANFVKWLVKNINISKNARILELGCGKGALLRSLKNDFGFTDLTGLEISPKSAKFAEQTGAKIYNEDVLANTLPKNNYDVIFCLAFLEHMNDPKVLLNEVYSLLKPKGHAYFLTPDLYGMTFRNKFFKFVHPYYFSDLTTRSLLEQCGFEIVATQSIPTLDQHASILNPANLIAGELHTIAMKSHHKRTLPIRDNYKKVVAHFWEKRLSDAPYEFMYKLMYSKYGGFLRALRNSRIKHLRRSGKLDNPYSDYTNYWARILANKVLHI